MLKILKYNFIVKRTLPKFRNTYLFIPNLKLCEIIGDRNRIERKLILMEFTSFVASGFCKPRNMQLKGHLLRFYLFFYVFIWSEICLCNGLLTI